MSQPADIDVPAAQSRAIASAVREALARRRISRQRLADEAKISISTLEKALAGRRPFTLATTVRLEEALGTRLRQGPNEAPAPASWGPVGEVAPDSLGSYARPAVAWLEGSYLTLRPSFGQPGAVYAYRTQIAWKEASSSLTFSESERLDTAFTQFGAVAVPHQSGHVYLITSRHGQQRLAVLGRPTISGEMYGILTTLQAGRGSQLTPLSAPIALVPIAAAASGLAFGRVAPGEPCHAAYRAHLERIVAEGYALFVTGQDP